MRKSVSKKYSIQTFLKLLAATIVIEIVGYFLDGYCLAFRDFNIILYFMFPIRILLVILVFRQIIRDIISRSYEWKYIILSVLLMGISMVPKEHYSTFGKIASMNNSDPTSVLGAARDMLDTYEPMTHFGRPHRTPFLNPRSLDEVPQKIKAVHKGEVLVLENAVLLENGSSGFEPAFEGFVVFGEGYDPWENEKQIVLDDFWYASWKVRIIDGLYWYKVDGYNNPFSERFQQERIDQLENSSE
jgi:cytochrome c oxidase subunit IV